MKLIGFLLLMACCTAQAGGKPNILLILADDLGYHDTGFQGSKKIKTPHLDGLAKRGVRFTDGHTTASVCSPSRAGLITGRYQQRFGHEANTPDRPHGMDVSERTLAQALRDCGYRTGLFGKWHLGSEPDQYPTARGFDRFWGLRAGSRSYWFKPKKIDQAGNPKSIESNGAFVKFDGYLTDCLTDEAIAFMAEPSEQPFFVFLSYTAPHSPLEPKSSDLQALGTKNRYAGLIYGMDRNIGRVLEYLKAGGRLENTLIWFLSDNGGIAKQASNKPLGGKKGTKFEGGMRVPFLLSWPGHVPAGSVYHPMVSALDIYPTCVAAAGGSLIQEKPLDGVDLLPYLSGQKDGVPHARLYWRKLECAAMRDGPWKLIRVEGLDDHLFNLERDIGEQNNLAEQFPERLEQMATMLRTWEADKREPLWEEDAKWTRVRYNYHKSWFETGKAPKKITGY